MIGLRHRFGRALHARNLARLARVIVILSGNALHELARASLLKAFGRSLMSLEFSHMLGYRF